MTAVVAAAAGALDLTGETVPADLAPADLGVLFLPQPIYHRGLTGHRHVTGIGAELGQGLRSRRQPGVGAGRVGRSARPPRPARYCLDEAGLRTPLTVALAYAFWRIQAQPLATVACAALPRPARRRAHRASIRHDTRVVMLRRTSPDGEPGGEPRWRYNVRFVVRLSVRARRGCATSGDMPAGCLEGAVA
jgi:hypothetical protein